MSRLVQRIARGVGLQPQAMTQTVVEHLFDGMLQTDSESGEFVSVEKSVGLPAVFKAIRLCSEVPGALPLITYKTDGEERDRDPSHPAYDLLHEEPNPEMSAVEFWTLLLAHLNGWGKLYIGKQFDMRGRLVGLYPIEPKKMAVERIAGGQLLFRESLDTGLTRTWTQSEIIYVRLFTLDGVNGLSPIGLQRETMGLAWAMRKRAARFFRDFAIPPGALTVEGEIKDENVRERLRQEWKQKHQGRSDIAILDAGAKFETISVPLRDAEFVELWGATKADVADMFNMPASLLNAPTGDSTTYGNRETDRQQFLTFTLHNPLRKVEQALTRDRDLFPRPDERRTHFCEFLREDLLRPDSRARALFYKLALNEKTGWMRRDEVRRLENLPRESAAGRTRVVEDAAAAIAEQNGNGHHAEVVE